MRKIVPVSALALTGMTFLVSALAGLPKDPTGINLGLKVTILASGVAFMLAVVVCVLVAWPEKQEKH